MNILNEKTCLISIIQYMNEKRYPLITAIGLSLKAF